MDITWYNMKLTIVLYWLVVWNMTYSIFPFSWECHHPNWLSHFSEGLKPPTSHVLFEIYKFTVSLIFRPIHILTYPRTLHDLGHLISAWPRFQGLPRGGTLQLRMEQWDEFFQLHAEVRGRIRRVCRASKFGTQPVSSNMAMDAMDKPHMRFEWGNHQWGIFHCHVWLQESKSSSSNWKGLFYLQRWP